MKMPLLLWEPRVVCGPLGLCSRVRSLGAGPWVLGNLGFSVVLGPWGSLSVLGPWMILGLWGSLCWTPGLSWGSGVLGPSQWAGAPGLAEWSFMKNSELAI